MIRNGQELWKRPLKNEKWGEERKRKYAGWLCYFEHWSKFIFNNMLCDSKKKVKRRDSEFDQSTRQNEKKIIEIRCFSTVSWQGAGKGGRSMYTDVANELNTNKNSEKNIMRSFRFLSFRRFVKSLLATTRSQPHIRIFSNGKLKTKKNTKRREQALSNSLK